MEREKSKGRGGGEEERGGQTAARVLNYIGYELRIVANFVNYCINHLKEEEEEETPQTRRSTIKVVEIKKKKVKIRICKSNKTQLHGI